jgi:hypothetical protein
MCRATAHSALRRFWPHFPLYRPGEPVITPMLEYKMRFRRRF